MDESESPSWKGHGFTLLVFGGIVVLCSIFFVLGMLVGRNQGQRIAETAAADATTQKAAQPLPEPKPHEFFNRTTEPIPDDVLQPRPTPPATPEGSVPAPAAPEPDPPAVKESEKFYLQILATKDGKEAERERSKVQSKGFRALVLPPKPGDQDPWHRVQVGPFDTTEEQTEAKKELESQGYKGVVRK